MKASSSWPGSYFQRHLSEGRCATIWILFKKKTFDVVGLVQVLGLKTYLDEKQLLFDPVELKIY